MNSIGKLFSKMSALAISVSVALAVVWFMAGVFMISQSFVLKGFACFGLTIVFLLFAFFGKLGRVVSLLTGRVLSVITQLDKELHLKGDNEDKIKLNLLFFNLDTETALKTGKKFTGAMWFNKNNRPYASLIERSIEHYFESNKMVQSKLVELTEQEKESVKENAKVYTKDLIEIYSEINHNPFLVKTKNNNLIEFK